MAEEPKQGKGIGELFVDFGAKGLGTLIKGLNTISASFLLTKNAAEQFVKPIINTGKQAANSAVDIAKLSASLGTTLLEAQKFQLYFQKHNLSESLLGDLSSMGDMLTKVSMGIGGISAEFAYAMHSMGLNWTDYDGSLESMLQLVKDVQKATEGMDPAKKRVMLQSVGLNPEWSYAFERGINLDDALAISDDDIKKLQELSEAMNETGQAFDKLKNQVVAKAAPIITDVANDATVLLSGKATDEDKKRINDKVSKAAEKNAVLTGTTVGIGTAGILGAPLAAGVGVTAANASSIAKMQRSIGGKTGKLVPLQFGAAPLDFGTAPWIKDKGQITGGAAPLNFVDKEIITPINMQNINPIPPALEGTNPAIPPNISNSQSANIYVTNENNINVANPQDVGSVVSSINQETLTNIEYSGFQINNRPGL